MQRTMTSNRVTGRLRALITADAISISRVVEAQRIPDSAITRHTT
jgi:hypothetical protein